MEIKKNRVHMIAIGGSIMHALAIALHKNGTQISGSDDQFFEPSKSKLKENGLLPAEEGWNLDRITKDLDAVILGMHAQADNPELVKAQELGIKVYSFPEFIYENSLNKQRVVIAGSHGKTTITSIIMHVLAFWEKDFDYAVGAAVIGFNNTVKLSDAPVIIIEGDEYLCSRIDPTPKFLKYKHHIGLISGIAWDHINVFPTEDIYLQQFDKFADATPKAGSLAFNDDDSLSSVIGTKDRGDVNKHPYGCHPHVIENNTTYLLNQDERVPVNIFGKHNMYNIAGAKEILSRLYISDAKFYEAIRSYKTPDKRLEVVNSNASVTVYKDYAHAPSKVLATTLALKEQFPDRSLIGCLELHTYSSLNKAFLAKYKDSLKFCNEAIVYFDPDAVALKNLEQINKEDIMDAFNMSKLKVFSDASEMIKHIKSLKTNRMNFLMMSSGNFGGLDLSSII